MAQRIRRILGIGFDGRPIYAPNHAHSLLLSAAGGGKTTCGAVPWLQSLLSDTARAIVVTDSKEGELAAQCADMCARAGRKVAIIDDFAVLGTDNPYYRISLNPYGGVISSYHKSNGELIFATENACHAAIEEPLDDAKNQYFRDEPRTLIEFCKNALLNRDPSLCTPGALWSLLAHPDVLLQAARIEAEGGHEALQALSEHVLGMAEHEHFPQHRSAALKAMRVYAANSALHQSGVDAELSHEDLIKDNYVVFLVGPVRHMDRLGIHYALHLQSFMEVVLSGQQGPVSFILDEFTNAPLKALVSQLTTMRGYGGTCHMIAQSLSEIERKYGKLETRTIIENSVIRQYFGFSSYEEADAVSRAMGETLSVSTSLGISSDKADFSGNYNTSKERLYTPDMLMSMPADEQIIYAKNVGYIHCRKVGQNQLAPYCHHLAPNPLEGGILKPDPKVTLPTPKSGGRS